MPKSSLAKRPRRKIHSVFLSGRGKHFTPSFVSHLRRSHSLDNIQPPHQRPYGKVLPLALRLLKCAGLLLLAWWIYESYKGLKIFN